MQRLPKKTIPESDFVFQAAGFAINVSRYTSGARLRIARDNLWQYLIEKYWRVYFSLPLFGSLGLQAKRHSSQFCA